MNDYLDSLEQQLVKAANARTTGRETPAGRHRRLSVSTAAALFALLVASAVALAVSGTFTTGSAVRAPERPVADAGVGVAARGTRLLPTRVADPAGGLPWGMRLVHTTRRLVCLQVGRIEGDRLGVLGQDGAFSDDSRFHPVSPDVVGYHRTTTEVSTCVQPGETTSLEAQLPQSGVFGSPHSESIPAAARRWISYGLLGPAAVSVTYRWGGRTRTIPVEPVTGAYLVALPDNPHKGGFETGGGDSSTNGYVTPEGVISSIAYRVHGRICDESVPMNEAAAAHPRCPRPLIAPRRGTPRRLGRPIRVRLSGGGTATVTFTAPHAVSSALSGYAVEVPSPCHKGIDVTPVERDLRAGQIVHVRLPHVFANICGGKELIRVVYEQDRNRSLIGEAEVIVGETTIGR